MLVNWYCMCPLSLGKRFMGYYFDPLWFALGDAEASARSDRLLAWWFGSPSAIRNLEIIVSRGVYGENVI